MLEFTQESQKKLFNLIAGSNGIKVVWDMGIKVPTADHNKTITLFPPNVSNSREFWKCSFHELAHLVKEMEWTYEPLSRHLNVQDELAHHVANVLLDNLVEENMFGEFPGIDYLFDSVYQERVDKIIANVLQVPPTTDKLANLMEALLSMDIRYRHFWSGYYTKCVNPEPIEKRQPYLVSKLHEIKVLHRLYAIKRSKCPEKDFAELVLDILKLIDYTPPPPPEGKGKGKGEGEGEDKGKGEGEGEGKGKGEGESKEGEGEQSVSGDSSGDAQDQQEAEDFFEEHGREVRGYIANPQKPVNWTLKKGDYSANAIKEILKKIEDKVHVESQRKSVDRYSGAGYMPYSRHDVVPCYNMVSSPSEVRTSLEEGINKTIGNSTVSKQIAKYLLAMKTESYSYGKSRGKIHSKSLHKLYADFPPGHVPRVFKQKDQYVLKNDAAVMLLQDCSGSMSGSKYVIASACSAALSQVCSDLRIPHEVLGFTDHGKLVTYEFKPFSVSLSREKVVKSLSSSQVHMRNNADGESLTYAAERLMLRPEKKKLLIVLSDGSPAGGYSGDPDAYLKIVTEKLETIKDLHLVGLGIATDAVKHFYTNHAIVYNPGELDTVLFGVLKKFLLY